MTDSEKIDKIVVSIMQSGLESAMYGSPLNTDEENEKQRDEYYEKSVSIAKQQIQSLIRDARIDELEKLKPMEFENGDDDFVYFDTEHVYNRLKSLGKYK